MGIDQEWAKVIHDNINEKIVAYGCGDGLKEARGTFGGAGNALYLDRGGG